MEHSFHQNRNRPPSASSSPWHRLCFSDLKSKGDAMGCWKLMVADFGFDEKNAPCLRNVKEYIPGDSVFYENHGFSPDGRYLLFTSNFDKHVSPLGGNKLYRLDLSTGKAELLAGEGY